MNDYYLYDTLAQTNASAWLQYLPEQLTAAFDASKQSQLPKWQAIIASLPELISQKRDLNSNSVLIGDVSEISAEQGEHLKQQLMQLHPWRKGPYELFGIAIDTEWRSDWKWQRLEQAISPLKHRLVLDVGCGNGYHCWRMAGAGAKLVVGIDPTLLSVMQFQAIKKLYGDAPVYVLPLGIEHLPSNLKTFDTVFSMGVLYHRRSPIDHLLELKDCLVSGGELVLETLVIDGEQGTSLVPEDRYAKMRNVWFIPSCATLMQWLRRCGFINIRLVDVSVTTIEEQRSTEWMRFHSLADFLHPDNPQLTCEGLPAPKRAIFIANVS
ncbi:MAG: tRNA 5-methoxyuridine(34)/uridine 5-oxyacetic acid(34) synthase CmoB [Methylococcaceae bacterium]